MTYPTEPNFIIKSSEYRAADTASKKSNVWGSMAYEGRNFIDNYIKAKKQNTQVPDIHYDPMASVPTGVGGGGARLKIETGKKYDKNSLFGRPHFDTTSVEGTEISVEDQYIVQAQSWAGASRIATAYRSAYEAKSGGRFLSDHKKSSVDAFAPIETMVKALVSDSKSVGDCKWDVSAFDHQYGTVIKVDDILKAVKTRLLKLEKEPSFAGLLK